MNEMLRQLSRMNYLCCKPLLVDDDYHMAAEATASAFSHYEQINMTNIAQ
jgi:hypothetical protein